MSINRWTLDVARFCKGVGGRYFNWDNICKCFGFEEIRIVEDSKQVCGFYIECKKKPRDSVIFDLKWERVNE
jgi:hypothetical protein